MLSSDFLRRPLSRQRGGGSCWGSIASADKHLSWRVSEHVVFHLPNFTITGPILLHHGCIIKNQSKVFSSYIPLRLSFYFLLYPWSILHLRTQLPTSNFKRAPPPKSRPLCWKAFNSSCLHDRDYFKVALLINCLSFKSLFSSVCPLICVKFCLDQFT